MTPNRTSAEADLTRIVAPQSRIRAAVARRDVTPPVGIYHRLWGAARHDRATGVHRPLLATALVFAPSSEADIRDAKAVVEDAPNAERPRTSPKRVVILALDLCILWGAEIVEFRTSVARQAGIELDELRVAFSHSHSSGLMGRERVELPGGDLILPYLERLASESAAAIRDALTQLQEADIVYGTGRCNLAGHRDFWDDQRGSYVCGFNPQGMADDTVLVARISGCDGHTLGTVVNYACHPTTLAWDNTLLSPDYVGAMRDVVEQATGAPCVFLQGASGDLGPREGFVGDTRVADRNGRQLGYAALSTLESLPAAGTHFQYLGAVESGTAIGTWGHRPLGESDEQERRAWRSLAWSVPLEYRPDVPKLLDLLADRERLTQSENQARARGDEAAARDARAFVERLTRQITRFSCLPPGEVFPLPVIAWQMGTAIWVMAEGEHYCWLQQFVREHVKDRAVMFVTLTNGARPTYLLPANHYFKGIYQETIALLKAGTLEQLAQNIAGQLREWR